MLERRETRMDTPTIREVKAWLEREVTLGLEAVPRQVAVPAAASPAAQAAPVAAKPPVRVAAKAALPDVLVEPGIRGAGSLEQLRDVLGDCTRCKLARGRTNIVFGSGNPKARLMFVGEGPGEEEDRQGEPFVGKAGELLDTIITNAIGLKRSDVYIANVVKCRPPDNRNPEPDEIVACEPFLRRQVELIRPEVIVSLGNFATQALLGDRTPISRRRGNWHEVGGTPLMPTFHPAYLLRNPSDKRLVWNDIKLVMEKLGLPLPARRGGA